jgi:hypothetical protein
MHQVRTLRVLDSQTATRFARGLCIALGVGIGMRQFDKNMQRAHRLLRLKVGDIYESCSYHPVLCLGVDYKQDEIWGVSLIDGTHPCSCSLVHCGVRKLTPKQAWEIKMRGPTDPEDRKRISVGGRWWNVNTEKNTYVVRTVGPRRDRSPNKPLKKRRAQKSARAS